jgi:hypothetical protein
VAEEGAQVEVEDVEAIVARVTAIDVAKASGMVCTRVPHVSRPGRRITKTWLARSILTIIWHLLADPGRPLHRPRHRLPHPTHRHRPQDTRPHPPLEALGHKVTLTPAEAA